MSSKKKMTPWWSTNGPEGIQLKKDIVEGVRDGFLDLDKPDNVIFNKSENLYQNFSKDSFCNHMCHAIADFRTSTANKEAASELAH